MDAAAAAPAPVIKRQRKARAVPKVRVYSRHRSECKWGGDDTRIGCDCPKQLTWFREHDGEQARCGARRNTVQDGGICRHRAHRHLRTPGFCLRQSYRSEIVWAL
jgi:hypothetical protein